MSVRGTGALLLVLSGCATPLSALSAHTTVETPVGTLTICALPHNDDADRVTHAAAIATDKATKWGTLEHPVDLYLMPTHFDLAWATRRFGFDWLRAWAQYDDVLVETPSSWSARDDDLAELLAHELTHCLMYQKSATREDWAKKPIPLWFREGMASWTAAQGHRWMTLEDLAHVYEERPARDPIVDAERLYKERSGAVYAAAHYAFTFLVTRYGTEAIERVMANMKQGEPFDTAFEHGIGLSTSRFVAEFRRYVTWRAFRGSGKPVSSN